MIIGICGLQGSGKDTLGSILVEKYGFKKLSYAGILKDIVSILFGLSRDMVEVLQKNLENGEKKLMNCGLLGYKYLI